jgi:transposase
VPIKSEAQQELKLVFQVRQRLLRARTALVNQTRGELSEFGVVLPKGISVVRRQLPSLLEQLRPRVAELMRQQYEELVALDRRIAAVTKTLEQMAKAREDCRRLMKLRGIGPITAVLLAAHCCPQAYRNGRSYAAVLGLVPRHDNSGDRVRIGRLTKSGQRDLRTLLIHGGRSVLKYAARHDDRLSRWALEVAARRGKNRAAVAVANKLARYAWAELMRVA